MRQHGAATWKLVSAFTAVYVIWGSTYLAIRLAIESIPPLLMLGGRFAVAGGLLYAVLRMAGVPPPNRFIWKNAILVGTLTLGVGTGAVAWSEQYVTSGVAALLVTTVPLFIVLLDWKWKKGVSPNGAIVAGLILGGIGIVLLVDPTDLLIKSSAKTNIAMVVILIGSFSWSFGSLLSRDVGLPDNPFMSTATQMIGGSIALISAGLIKGEGAILDLSAITQTSWMALGYLFVFGSIIAFTSYVWLMKNAPAGQVSTYAYVNPVVAVLLGWLVADEVLNARIVIAMVILVAAVVLISRFGSRASGRGKPLPAWLRKNTWLYSLDRPALGAQAAIAPTETSGDGGDSSQVGT